MRMSTAKFEVVSDKRRRPANNSSPLWQAVRSGKTVLVHGRKIKDFSGSRTYMRQQGFQVFCRQEEEGVIIWAEKLEE